MRNNEGVHEGLERIGPNAVMTIHNFRLGPGYPEWTVGGSDPSIGILIKLRAQTINDDGTELLLGSRIGKLRDLIKDMWRLGHRCGLG